MSAPFWLQRARVLQRPGMTEARLSAILAQQLSDAEKRRNLNREIFRTAVEAGGAISVEHGIGTAKMSYFVETVDPALLALMRSIKEAFDPRGILGPGRMPGTAEVPGEVHP